jgi:hypothetical protein
MAEERRIETSETSLGASPRTGDGRWSRQEAQHIQEELLKKGESFLGNRKTSFAEVLRGIANVLEKSAGHFEEETQPNSARYAREAAKRVHGFARDLRDRDIETLKSQIADLVKRQPALIVAGAAVAGFLVTRYLKSTADYPEQEYSESRQGEQEETLFTESEKNYEEREEEFLT